MVRIAKRKVDKIVRDALEVAFPLSGKFGDGNEATSRESDVITPCNEGIFDECDDIISVLPPPPEPTATAITFTCGAAFVASTLVTPLLWAISAHVTPISTPRPTRFVAKITLAAIKTSSGYSNK